MKIDTTLNYEGKTIQAIHIGETYVTIYFTDDSSIDIHWDAVDYLHVYGDNGRIFS